MLCSESGNINTLKKEVGLADSGSHSVKDMAAAHRPQSPLPNFDELHKKLMEDEEYGEVLDYLVVERKWSIDVLKRFKIGANTFTDKESVSYKCVVIPSFDRAGNAVTFKARSLPPVKKFFAPSGREAPLFNEAVIREGIERLVIAEGEADTLSLISAGFDDVVGVPGASVKKATWLDKLDRVAPKQIYLVYDTDDAGQKNAKEMAIRIGIDRVLNVVLPPFEIQLEDGTTKKGKDLNEWFVAGNTLEDFMRLLEDATPFDVDGVVSASNAIKELISDIEDRGVEPTYDTPWSSLTKLVGGFEDGDLVGVLAAEKIGKTKFCLNWLDYEARRGNSSLLFCLETQPKQLVRQWSSLVTLTDDTPGRSQLTKETILSSLDIAEGYKGDLLFGYSRVVKPKEVFDTIRQAVRRYGLKFVCFDNLQLLCRNIQYQSQETSVLSKEFKALAMELNIVVLLIIQPHRLRDGEIVGSNNVMGSSAVPKDVDAMVCLHRKASGALTGGFEGLVQVEESFEPHLFVKVDRSRRSPGGACTLWFDGCRSLVREMADSDLGSASKADDPPFEANV